MSANHEAHLLAEFPLSVVCGGLELQCIKTYNALREEGGDVELLDYHDPSQRIEILHIFGNPPSIYEVCQHGSRSRIIISAVCGSKGYKLLPNLAQRTLARMASVIREKTNYSRVRESFHLAETIICLNELEKHFIHKAYDIPLDRITIIPNGVEPHYHSGDPTLFTERHGLRDFVLFSGNIVARKNPLRLARALKRVGFPGVFIGGTLSSEQEYADAFAKEVANAENLLWIPRIHYQDPLLSSAYAAARVFCLPSESETQSLSALEAMATSTPLILADRPYAYQHPFEKALRCDPKSEESIGACVVKAYDNPAPYQVPLPEAFNWHEIARRIQDLYRSKS